MPSVAASTSGSSGGGPGVRGARFARYQFPQTGRIVGTRPSPAAAACAVQADVAPRERRACERDPDEPRHGGHVECLHGSQVESSPDRLRGWSAGDSVQWQKIFDFPKEVRSLNGSCLIGPRTMVVADSLADLIWRVDLPKDDETPVARVWLRHESMGNYPGQMKPEQPGG